MAEQGTEKQQEAQEGPGEFNEQEYEREYELAMNEDDSDKGSSKDAGAAETDKKPAEQDGTGKQPPAEKPATGATDTTAAEDQQFLTSLGFDEAEAKEITPKELARLKKVHAPLMKEIQAQRGRADWFAKTNQNLSAENKKLKGSQAALERSKPITTEEVKAFREKHKDLIAALPAGAQQLWQDDDFVMTQMAMQRAMQPAVPEEDRTAGAAEETPLTEEQQAQFEDWKKDQASKLSAAIEAAGHKDYKEVFASKDFAEWLGKMPLEYKALLLNPFNDRNELDPSRTLKVLQDYRLHRTSIEAQRQVKAEADEKANALRTHGGGTRVPDAGDDDKDPMDMTPAEFAAYEAKIRRSMVRVG